MAQERSGAVGVWLSLWFLSKLFQWLVHLVPRFTLPLRTEYLDAFTLCSAAEVLSYLPLFTYCSSYICPFSVSFQSSSMRHWKDLVVAQRNTPMASAVIVAGSGEAAHAGRPFTGRKPKRDGFPKKVAGGTT